MLPGSLPLGFLLTQYTITGFDASAHLSEETQAASSGAAKGIWRSIFYSVLGGYVLLLCVVFAIPDNAQGDPDNTLAGLWFPVITTAVFFVTGVIYSISHRKFAHVN